MNNCDHTTAGVLIHNPAGELLLLERRHPPLGMAPPTAHLTDHVPAGAPAITAFPMAAARTVSGLIGLTVDLDRLRPVVDQHADNRCRRPAGDGRPPGHFWRVYTATATGDVITAPEGARRAAWHNPATVEALANRTVAWARRELPETDFDFLPGLEPIWVWWLHLLGHLPRLDPRDAVAVLAIATRDGTGTR